MKTLYGHVKTDPGETVEFPFEVEDNATEENIETELVAAMWESGLVDLYYTEESEDDE